MRKCFLLRVSYKKINRLKVSMAFQASVCLFLFSYNISFLVQWDYCHWLGTEILFFK